jgi:acylphosphatase
MSTWWFFNMTNKICKHYYVTGKVQGVWFRASTQKEAKRLGVTGWVRNLPDGRVEVMAAGSDDLVLQLEVWLRRGPERAVVTDLAVEELPWQECVGFDVIS